MYEVAVQRSQENLDRSSKMFDIGSVAKIDVFRSRVTLGNDEIAYIQQRNATSTAVYTLNILMGRDPKDPLVIEDVDGMDYAVSTLDILLQEGFNAHPDIRRLELDVRSKELSKSIAKSVFMPSVSAFFNYDRNNADIGNVYSDFDQNWSYVLGLSASVNLFNGFQDQVNVQNSDVALKNAQIALKEFKFNLESTIRNLHQNYLDLQEIVQINASNVEASREEYRLATERFRLGSGTSLDVREAQVSLTDAERILVAAQYDLIINYIELQESIGQVQSIYR